MIKDTRVRTEVTRASHYWFFLIYLPDYVKHPFADFHHEMFAITEDENFKMGVVIAFRGSGKSTIFTLSYPIWAVLGKPQKKYVVLVAQTQAQAKLYLTNIKRELESNTLLRADLGPFEEKQEEWSAGSLVIPKYGARITAVSTEQSIRGIRHGSHRPDLIICDDLEDLASAKTLEGRQKMWQWLMGDVIPSGDLKTKVVCVGNMLHEASLLMRLTEEIENGTRDGLSRTYPILNEDGTPTWPGKFRTAQDIINLCRTVDDSSWNREYLLRIVSDAERVIHPEWIYYYDGEPPGVADPGYRCLAMGVDIAVSTQDLADFTAIVSGRVIEENNEGILYVLPNPVNQKLEFPDIIAMIKGLVASFRPKESPAVYVEEVGIQLALTQQLLREGVRAEGMRPNGIEKRERLALIANYVKIGRIRFPHKGAELLIAQIVDFGKERHDDLADALTVLVNMIAEHLRKSSGGGIIVGGKPRSREFMPKPIRWDQIF